MLLTLDRILRDPDIVQNHNFRFSALYDFGCLFGWIEILLRESFSEVIETPDKSKDLEKENTQDILKGLARTDKYQYHLEEFLRRITFEYYRYYKSSDPFVEIITSLAIPRWTLTGVGQLMIDEQKENDDTSNVINLVNFTKKYGKVVLVYRQPFRKSARIED